MHRSLPPKRNCPAAMHRALPWCFGWHIAHNASAGAGPATRVVQLKRKRRDLVAPCALAPAPALGERTAEILAELAALG